MSLNLPLLQNVLYSWRVSDGAKQSNRQLSDRGLDVFENNSLIKIPIRFSTDVNY